MIETALSRPDIPYSIERFLRAHVPHHSEFNTDRLLAAVQAGDAQTVASLCENAKTTSESRVQLQEFAPQAIDVLLACYDGLQYIAWRYRTKFIFQVLIDSTNKWPAAESYSESSIFQKEKDLVFRIAEQRDIPREWHYSHAQIVALVVQTFALGLGKERGIPMIEKLLRSVSRNGVSLLQTEWIHELVHTNIGDGRKWTTFASSIEMQVRSLTNDFAEVLEYDAYEEEWQVIPSPRIEQCDSCRGFRRGLSKCYGGQLVLVQNCNHDAKGR